MLSGGERRLTPIHLVARPLRIAAVRKADEGETLRTARFAVLGEEDTRDAAEALEHVSQVAFFGELGDLL